MNFPFSFHWSVPLFLSSFVEIIVTHLHLFVNTFLSFFYFIKYCQFICICIELYPCKSDIRNPLSLLAHERSRFATCQWELLTPTDISIPLTHRLVLYALEAGECLFCVQITMRYNYIFQFAKTVSPLNQPANTHHRPILFSSQSELRLPLL